MGISNVGDESAIVSCDFLRRTRFQENQRFFNCMRPKLGVWFTLGLLEKSACLSDVAVHGHWQFALTSCGAAGSHNDGSWHCASGPSAAAKVREHASHFKWTSHAANAPKAEMMAALTATT